MSKAKNTVKTISKKATKPQAAPQKMGVLDAAAKVLAEAGKPMNAKAMVEAALAKGYWKTGGKTPWGTLYAAVIREIAVKKDKARFRKPARGMFELAK